MKQIRKEVKETAAVVTLNKIGVSLKLNNGTSTTGAVKTVSISLGSALKTNGFNADKVMAIVGALTPNLTKSLISVNKTDTSAITNG